MLHWGQDKVSDISNRFDVIITSDCTFFKEFHGALVWTIKSLLKKEGPSEAILFSPKRGDSLDKFLVEVKDSGLRFRTDEIYDTEVWRRHQQFINGDDSWPNYEMDHILYWSELRGGDLQCRFTASAMLILYILQLFKSIYTTKYELIPLWRSYKLLPFFKIFIFVLVEG